MLQVWYIGSIYRVVLWYLIAGGLFWTGWYGGESVGYLKALFLFPESPGQVRYNLLVYKHRDIGHHIPGYQPQVAFINWIQVNSL